ncbi:hypothetical protein AB0890_21815 [Streptomyces sp. NPDC005406]|uniref:hypothetical protein n=1 Tax=Streptomyces sp. NPDC005406 TaxID=3155339 RepID=UPI003452C18E
MRFGRSAVRVLCAAALSLTAACSLAARDEAPPRVAEEDLPGHWQGSCGATIDFATGGTYEFGGFPVEGEPGGEPQRISGKGTWILVDTADGGAPREMQLEGEREFYTLALVKDGDSFKLHQWVGDPDDGNDCTYRR